MTKLLENGTPQGSVLSPVVFSLINDLPDVEFALHQHETFRDSETQRKTTSNAIQKSDLEACQWFYGITMIGTNIETRKSRITLWTEFQENEVTTK